MSNLQREIETGMSRLLRRTAREYGDAVTEYGNAFIAYSKGQIDAAKVAETTMKLAAGEARRVIETGMELGAAYTKWATALVGMQDLTASDAPAEPAKPQAGRTARKRG